MESATVSNTPIQIPISITGTSGSNYRIPGNAYSINVTIISATFPPSLTILTPSYYDGGNGNLSITSPVNGNYYYSLREGFSPNDVNSVSYYITQIDSANNGVIQSQADFLTHLYVSPRNWITDSATLKPEITN